MSERQLRGFKHNNERSLILFFIDNSTIIHPEILAMVQPILKGYQAFFEELKELGPEQDESDVRKAFSVFMKGDLFVGSLEEPIFHALLDAYLDEDGLRTVSEIETWMGFSKFYDIILDIHGINDALVEGIEAWEDAIYLYRYNFIKDIKCKLAKSPTSKLVMITGLKNGTRLKHGVTSYGLLEALLQSAVGRDIIIYEDRHWFNTRLDAIAYERQLAKALDAQHEKANALVVKYALAESV